jgi:hypothetical protein
MVNTLAKHSRLVKQLYLINHTFQLKSSENIFLPVERILLVSCLGEISTFNNKFNSHRIYLHKTFLYSGKNFLSAV